MNELKSERVSERASALQAGSGVAGVFLIDEREGHPGYREQHVQRQRTW
jgi:FtsP/CotA-like multicopper oxidase with cupredoxin domain